MKPFEMIQGRAFLGTWNVISNYVQMWMDTLPKLPSICRFYAALYERIASYFIVASFLNGFCLNCNNHCKDGNQLAVSGHVAPSLMEFKKNYTQHTQCSERKVSCSIS